MKFRSIVLFALVAFAGGAVAQTLPDGPVASPPGWACTAHSGTVSCVKIPTQGAPG